LSYNLLGYLPAPSLYGWFNDKFGGDDPEKATAGMSMLMSVSIVCAVLLAIAIPFRKIDP